MDSTLEIKLAGFNVDLDGLKEIKNILQQDRLSKKDKETGLDILKNSTPETIAASYARISRDQRPIPELRADARKDVEGSRKSNKAIIFTMGHKSIAEHAFFNFDIMGISRRAVEAVEEKRLQSYTEKSQRYITLDGDFVIPKEIQKTPFEKRFVQLIELQNSFYQENLLEITDWHKKQDYSDLFSSLNCSNNPDRQRGTVEGLGKEDARYALAQATQAQLGMSVSARNLESLITRLRSSDILEFQEIGERLFAEVDGIAPSVIKYTEPVDYFSKTRHDMETITKKLIKKYSSKISSSVDCKDDLSVVFFRNLKRDDSIIAGMLFSSSDISYENCLKIGSFMETNEKIALLDAADRYQEKHDPKIREYELGDRIAEFTTSSSGFAQLKRHRMNTLISQKYIPSMGHITPESIRQVGLDNVLSAIMVLSNKLYHDMLECEFPREIAEYALTNAHKRRSLFDANNRQAYAFCAERENLPAQWEIRHIANDYHNSIQAESPLTARDLCGKDRFYETKKRIQDEK